MKFRTTKITFALATALLAQSLAAFGQSEVWVTPTGTDGTGSGTAASPYVRSSAATFDTLINSTTSPIPTNSTIHLMAGTFLTAGQDIFPEGCKIRGAGIDVTTVRAANNAVTASCPLIRSFGNGGEVSDLTVDCNLANQDTELDLTAVNLGGCNTKISRVKAINWGSTATNEECFVFMSGDFSETAVATNVLIEDCIVTQPAQVTWHAGGDGFTIVGWATEESVVGGPGWLISTEIRNCRCSNIGAGGSLQPEYFSAIQIGASSKGVRVDGNIFQNAGTAVYSSCGSLLDCSIENNLFLDSPGNGGCAISFPESDACYAGTNLITTSNKRNIQIIDNLITVQAGGNAIGIAGIFGNYLEGLDIENNLITTSENNAGSFTGISAANVTNFIAKNNTVDTSGGTSFVLGTNVNVSQISGNQNLAGTAVAPSGWVPANSIAGLLGGTGIAIASQGTAAGVFDTVSLGVTNSLQITASGTGSSAYLVYTNPDWQHINLGFSSSPTIAGVDNTVFGYQSLWESQIVTNLVGNTAIGMQSMMWLTNAGGNTACGLQTLNGYTGSENAAFGWGALAQNNGNYNTGIGAGALNFLSSGSSYYNTAVGFNSMDVATNANCNTIVGANAGQGNHTGNFNVIVGQGSGSACNSSFNILIGDGVEVPTPDIGSQMNIGGVIFGNGLANNWQGSALASPGNIGLFTTNLTQANFTVNGTSALQSNVVVYGTLTVNNGIASTLSNALPAVAITFTNNPYFWTNTTSQDLVVYLNGLRGSVGYNGSPLIGPVTNCPVTVILQPSARLAITNTSGSGTLLWHPL